jgi:hypothetical protein
MPASYTLFHRDRQLITGPLDAILAHARPGALVFDDATGELVKFNTPAEIDLARRAECPASGPPISLSAAFPPRQAAWLQAQPQGAAPALRQLVAEAMRADVGRERRAKHAAYQFLSMLAGDWPGFEDATRALFAGDLAAFEAAAAAWPADVRAYGRRLAAPAFEAAR